MVNPVKAFNRATGLSTVLDAKENAQIAAVQQAGQAESQVPGSTAPPPQAAPLVGAEAAPKRAQAKTRQFAPAILGTGGDATTGGKTLLGQ